MESTRKTLLTLFGTKLQRVPGLRWRRFFAVVTFASLAAGFGTVASLPAPVSATPPPPSCQDSWIATGGGNWTTGADWSTGVPPTSSQYACITIPLSSSAPVVVNGTDTADGLTVGGSAGTSYVKIFGDLSLGADSNITVNGNVNFNIGNVTMASGTTLANDGTADETGNMQFDGNLTNNADGLLEVSSGVGLPLDTGTLTNLGTLFISSEANLTAPAGGDTGAVIDNAGGVIYDGGPNGSVGTIDVGPGATFEQGAGEVVGSPVYLGYPSGGALDLTGDGPGTFLVQSGATLTGNIAAGQTVIFEGNVTVAGSFTNAGTLEGGGGASPLTLPSGDTLTNTGTIAPLPGNTILVAGNVVNEPGGTIAMNGSTFGLSGAVTLTNDGTITVPPNSELESGTTGTIDNDGGTITNGGTVLANQGGTFIEGGGTTTGNPVDDSGALDLTGDGASSFQLFSSTNTITGNIAAGQIVEEGSTLTASGSFTNNGTFIGDGGGGLVLPTGDTFTNNGTIEFGHGGSGSGGFALYGNLTNSATGVMGEQGAGFQMFSPDTTFDNAGTMYLLFSTGINLRGNSNCGASGQQACDIDWTNTGTIYWGVDSTGSAWGGFGLTSDFLGATGDVVNLGGNIVPVPIGEPAVPPSPLTDATISYGIGSATMPPGTSTPTWTMICGASVSFGWGIACPDTTNLYEPEYGSSGSFVPTDVNLTSTGTEGEFGWASTYGQPVTITATVSAEDDSTPTGTVAFYAPQENTAAPSELRPDLLGTAPLVTSGGVTTATLTAPLPPGQYDLMAYYLGDGTHLPGSTQYGNVTNGSPQGGTQNVSPQTSSVAVASSSTTTGFGQPVTFTATVTPGTPSGPASPSGVVTFESNGVAFATAPVTTTGGVTTAQVTTANLTNPENGNVDSITAVYIGDYNYTGSTSPALTQTVTLTGPQLITFNAPATGTVNGSAPLTPTSTSSLGVTVTVDASTSPAGACTLSGSPGAYTVDYVHAGSCVLDASQAGNTSYAPALQVQGTIAIGPASQTVAFTTTAPTSATVGGASYTPAASATSGLPVTISLDATSTGCALNAGVVTFTAAGNCVIDASQSGDTDYTAATPVDQSIPVTNSGPTVSGVAPAAGRLSGGTSVTITGSGFVTGAKVHFGSAAGTRVIVVNPTTITAKSPAGSAGTVDVTVTTSGGTSASTPADQFIYLPVPTVSGVSPSSGPLDGGTSVSVTGTGFFPSATASFGTTAASVTYVSPTQLTVTAPARSVGAVNVRVMTPGGKSATSTADRFTYLPVPTVSGVSPSSGPLDGGTTVLVKGTGFVAGAAVSFGPTTATSASVTFVSRTRLSVTVPAGSGVVDVTVSTPGGTSATSSGDQFTYLPPPSVSGVAPATGRVSGGTLVTITGSGFVTGAKVHFGTAGATAVSVVNPTTITAKSPAGSPGTVDVTVTTPGGTSATSAGDQYTYG